MGEARKDGLEYDGDKAGVVVETWDDFRIKERRAEREMFSFSSADEPVLILLFTLDPGVEDFRTSVLGCKNLVCAEGGAGDLDRGIEGKVSSIGDSMILRGMFGLDDVRWT